MRRVLAVQILALALAGCAARPIHPGAVDRIDSTAYDTLIVAQAVLDEAKAQIKSGKLPASSKTIVNQAGAAYDVARQALKTYHESAADVRAGDAAALSRALADVDRLITQVRGLTTGGAK